MEKERHVMICSDLRPENGTDPAAYSWKLANARMLGYLDALGLSPVEAMHLALEATRRTRERTGTAEENPVPESMRILRELVRDRVDAADGTCRDSEHHFLPAAPGWNRGAMVPQRLDITPWDGVFGRVFARLRIFVPYLGMILVLILIYFML